MHAGRLRGRAPRRPLARGHRRALRRSRSTAGPAAHGEPVVAARRRRAAARPGPTPGVRSYLAVAGGIDVDAGARVPVHRHPGLGRAAPGRGRRACCRSAAPPGSRSRHDTPATRRGPGRCGCGPGPRVDWFAGDALDRAVRRAVRRDRGLQPGRAAADGRRAGRGRRTGRAAQRGDGARRGAGAAGRAAGGAPGRPPADRRLPGDRRRAAPRTCGSARSCGPGDEVRFTGPDSGGRQALSAGSSAAKDRTGPARRLGGLEAHRHHARAPSPRPSRGPSRRARRPCPGPRSGACPAGRRLVVRRVLVVGSGSVVAEQVLLDPVGQPGDADPEQPDAAGGVEVGEQARGPAGRSSARCRWARAAWSTG